MTYKNEYLSLHSLFSITEMGLLISVSGYCRDIVTVWDIQLSCWQPDAMLQPDAILLVAV